MHHAFASLQCFSLWWKHGGQSEGFIFMRNIIIIDRFYIFIAVRFCRGTHTHTHNYICLHFAVPSFFPLRLGCSELICLLLFAVISHNRWILTTDSWSWTLPTSQCHTKPAGLSESFTSSGRLVPTGLDEPMVLLTLTRGRLGIGACGQSLIISRNAGQEWQKIIIP